MKQTLVWLSIISAGLVIPISLEQLSLTGLLLPGLGALLGRSFCGWEPFRIPFSGGEYKSAIYNNKYIGDNKPWYKPWVPLQKPGLVPINRECGDRNLLKGSPLLLSSQGLNLDAPTSTSLQVVHKPGVKDQVGSPDISNQATAIWKAAVKDLLPDFWWFALEEPKRSGLPTFPLSFTPGLPENMQECSFEGFSEVFNISRKHDLRFVQHCLGSGQILERKILVQGKFWRDNPGQHTGNQVPTFKLKPAKSAWGALLQVFQEEHCNGKSCPIFWGEKSERLCFSHLSLHRNQAEWLSHLNAVQRNESDHEEQCWGWPVLWASATTPSPKPSSSPNWNNLQMEWLPAYLEKEMKIYVNTQNMKFCTCHALTLTIAVSSSHLLNDVWKWICCQTIFINLFFYTPELKISVHQHGHWYSSTYNFCLI